MGSVMACAILVIGNDGADNPSLPNKLNLDGVDRPLKPESVFMMDGYRAREYTVKGETIIVVKVAKITIGIVAVVWVPSDSVTNAKGWFDRIAGNDLTILGQWKCVMNAGDFTSPALVADVTEPAMSVKAAWPTSWRKRRVGESGDPKNGVPVPAPTGVPIIGVTIA